VKTLLLAQACFYGGLVVCVLLKPAGLGGNNGISYYGIYRQTFFPYAVGLLGGAYFVMRASDLLRPNEQIIRLLLRLFAVLVAGIVITPYAAGRWMDYLHTTCGATLFSLQLLLSGWLAWRLRYAWWSVLLTVIELAAGIASAIYLRPTHGLLLQTQLLFQIAFWALCTITLPKFTDEK